MDEIGGLSRALAHAARTYCTSPEDAQVVVWPKSKSLWDRWKEARRDNASAMDFVAAVQVALQEYFMIRDNAVHVGFDNCSYKPSEAGLVEWLLTQQHHPHKGLGGLPGTLSGVLATMDENSALQCLLQASVGAATAGDNRKGLVSSLPPDFWQ